MYALKKESPVIRSIRAFIAACLGMLYSKKRPADDTESFGENEMASPVREKVTRMSKELREHAEYFVFLLSIICIALMLLLGLALPAIVMTNLCLLILERRTRYRTSLAPESCPA